MLQYYYHAVAVHCIHTSHVIATSMAFVYHYIKTKACQLIYTIVLMSMSTPTLLSHFNYPQL